ncbi:peptidylprolyl isomerase [Sphingomonas xinjiangensis]|uniref:peptidylprolyl isomerase n=1 Tax=Sphingomonas xinjiangensis TaxID=643568 RepID=A0A840YGI2_9SPHN|nr:peptidylprolyl isomerase [Sphingomonas xinjiangensis]MBB5709898.1 peptidyl-prolyl cis-trans isomerase A (cyclophilin A) [Sphingomonas xinjiangensis]
MRRLFASAALLSFTLTASASPPPPALTRVRIVTSEGAIVVALEAKRAPKTTANFLVYVDDGRFDGTAIYRSARRKADPKFGFIQGGIGTDARRILPSPPLEPTNKTGIRHVSGTISMAHGSNPDSATGNFSIMVGDNRGLDAKPGARGFAAFGHVVAGMDVVKRILGKPTCCGRDAMRGQMIQPPVKLVRVERLDGTAKPTGLPKPWTLGIPRR